MSVSLFFTHLNKNQLDAQFIFSIFRQTSLHISGCIYSPSSGDIPYGYNNWNLLFFLDDSLLSRLGWNSLNEYTEMHGQQSIKFVCLRLDLPVSPLLMEIT